MAALTAARNTRRMVSEVDQVWAFKMAAVKIYQGSLVVIRAGYARPGATATGDIAVGRATKTVDNSAGAAGDLWIEVDSGIFKWANDTGDALAQADVGAEVYVTDDQTVSKTATGKSVAGKLYQVDSDGVWVKTVLERVV